MAFYADSCVKFIRNSRLNQVELRFSRYRQHVFHKHTHDTYSVGVVLEGKTEFFCHNLTEVIGCGEVALINPGEVHACNPQIGSALTYYMFYIEPALIQAISQELSEKSVSIEFVTSIVRDRHLYRALMNVSRVMANTHDALEIETLLYETLAALIKCYGDIKPQKPVRLRGVDKLIGNGRAYLMDNLSQNVSLDELAMQSGLSPFHFLREFRKRYGLPPHTYQLQQRITSAKRLLAQGKPIAHVATDVGFSDQSHFTRKFKAYVGTTPRRYQLANG
ncbi:MAG: AraC family transcriptional regulator [Anaerolineae bacterium]|nr:AraC family transcriptional regulator [Anaerolineae bacterium]